MKYLALVFIFLIGCEEDEKDPWQDRVDGEEPTNWIEPDNPIAPEYLPPPQIDTCESSLCFSKPIVVRESVKSDGEITDENSFIWFDDIEDYCFSNGWKLPRFDKMRDLFYSDGLGIFPSIIDCGNGSLEVTDRVNGGEPQCFPMEEGWYRVVAYCVKDQTHL